MTSATSATVRGVMAAALMACLTASAGCANGGEAASADAGLAADGAAQVPEAPDADTDDPIEPLRANLAFRTAYDHYVAAVEHEGFAASPCPEIHTADAAPPAIEGLHRPTCGHLLTSQDGTGGQSSDCAIAFDVADQRTFDADTDVATLSHPGLLVPGTGEAWIRGSPRGVGVWTRVEQEVEALDCTLTTISFVDVLPERDFACGFTAIVDGGCESLDRWTSWQARYAPAD